MEKEVLSWVKDVDPDVLERMLPHKLDPAFQRPSFLDTFAQQAIVISKRSTCMWNEVGALVMYKNEYMLSSGYNGPVRGDVDPREAGCARVVDGRLKEGAGLCRGSHAELNAMENLTISTININPDDLSIMVTIRPCFSCARQIVNKKIRHVYYIWEYELDEAVSGFLQRMGVVLEKYSSPLLEEWIQLNNYVPQKIKLQQKKNTPTP